MTILVWVGLVGIIALVTLALAALAFLTVDCVQWGRELKRREDS